MNAPLLLPDRDTITYPESDGLPIADNTLQLQYIFVILGGLDALFADHPTVFVAGNLLWYPVQGNNTIRQAPDVFAAFGRPKGHRGSYRQWEEGDIAPQVVFEILSPGNRRGELAEKFAFYQRYGVEEYYVYDPDRGILLGWQRQEDQFVEIVFMFGWVSPRLGIRFELVGKELELYRPDERKFATYAELDKSWQKEHAERKQMAREAALEKQRAEEQARRADLESERAEEQARRAEEQARRAEEQARRADLESQRAEEQTRRADLESQRAEKLLVRLRALGIDPDA